jgi:uncharacterized membrane protein YhfC
VHLEAHDQVAVLLERVRRLVVLRIRKRRGTEKSPAASVCAGREGLRYQLVVEDDKVDVVV